MNVHRTIQPSRAFGTHVLQLDVAMKDVLGVRVSEALDELAKDVASLGLGEAVPRVDEVK